MSTKWLLSATELETFNTCPRKWAYSYLDNIKPPASQAMTLGKNIHSFLENFLINGYEKININSKEGLITSPGLQFLPKRLCRENVEKYFIFENKGMIFHGYIDFYENLGSQKWLIGDHKTTSSLKNILSPDKLKNNIQAILYAKWLFETKNAKIVDLHWIYYATKGKPKAKLVKTSIKKEEEPSLFKHPLQIASSIMTSLENKASSKDMPKNLGACFKYGKCGFYDMCKEDKKTADTPIIESNNRCNNFFKKNIIGEIENHNNSQLNTLDNVNKNSFHLFIDCAPIKSKTAYKNTVELSDLLKPILKKIKEDKNIAHYRLVGYGQHVGVMAQYLQDFLLESKFDNSCAILSSSKTPEGLDTMQTLSAAASVVVRGF